MPSKRRAVALIALMIVSGCLAAPGGGGAAAQTAESPTAPGPEAVVVDYGDLPKETRPFVRTAVDTGSVTTVATRLDGLEPRETTHLRYDGTLYGLSWRRGGYRAEYSLNEVEPVDASAIGPTEDVADYGDLSSKGKRLFDGAFGGEPSRSYDPQAFPGELTHVDYVAYRGTHYRLLVAVADIPEVTLHVEPVDSAPNGASSTN